MMIPKEHQFEFAEKCWSILSRVGYVYLAGKPRSGKTLVSILTCEKSSKINNVLVLTTRKAIGYPEKKDSQGTVVKGADGKPILVTNTNSRHYREEDEMGWLKTLKLSKPWLKHNYTVTNYEQVGSVKGNKVQLKLNPEDYDVVIIDESHNLGKVGPTSSRYRVIKAMCKEMPHIHLSGTAIVESPNSIYYQMSISEFNPFPYKNFYEFFLVYGEPYYIPIGGRDITQYDKAKPELMPVINEFTVYMTQEDAGISSDIQAVDKLHYIELEQPTRQLYNTLQTQQFADVGKNMFNSDSNKPYTLLCDNTMKLRVSLHMLESGVSKVQEAGFNSKNEPILKDVYIDLGNNEKINYVLDTFGDTEEVGIMCHFIGEQIKLAKYFKRASIYSSKADAEGVDLSHLKYFVILSNDYSGSKFIQRRDRIINMEGSNTLTVHHILVKKAISDQVYKRTSKKENFNNSTYDREAI